MIGKTTLLISLLYLLSASFVVAQENNSRFSGNLEANGNFFLRDTAIGAANTPQYDRQLYGADAWLNLNYSNWGFDLGVRFDLFNNSNLLNPQGSYTAEGIGRWFIKKQINKLGISVGYLYDQVGSGIIFRAYEERPLLIDNALKGLRLTYDFSDDWRLKAFTGRQKQQFDVYDSVLKGANLDGFYHGGELSNWSLAPGIGLVNRTLDDNTMNSLVNTINSYSITDSIAPEYNAYAFSLYNTLTAGNVSWYAEGAYKTEDVYFDPLALKTNRDGSTSFGKLVKNNGYVLYSSLSYATKGLGITLEGKHTESFSFRTWPFATGNRAMINFIPPMARVNTYRLLARYTPATQDLGENAVQLDVRYSPSRKLSFNVNGAYISDLDGELLYREVFTEVLYKYKRKWQLLGGVQSQEYNQERYLVKPQKDNVKTWTPYAEFLYKFSRKKSLRTELQYMSAEEDFGSWLFALVEFGIAPHWTFTASDMFNISPNKKNVEAPRDSKGKLLKVHYPRFDVYYTKGASRFSLSYVKQVEGIVCAGGICRLEPAFSGFKFTVSSTF